MFLTTFFDVYVFGMSFYITSGTNESSEKCIVY